MNLEKNLLSPCWQTTAAAMLLLCSAAAQAVVSAPTASGSAGELEGMTYGNTGNVFQWQPLLFVNGLGSTSDPVSVTTLNSALDYSFGFSGEGTNLFSVRYEIRNNSATNTFQQLRFMLFANTDGEQTAFLDQASETWGAALAGDPARREVRALDPGNPLGSILNQVKVNNNLSDGAPSAACAAAAGCDATLGLQWNADELAPGERFVVTVGLSDDGQSLSSRFLTLTSVAAAGTELTVSGTGVVSAVPEASTWAMWAAGLGAVGGFVGRGRRLRRA
jgi:hypothetical protein